MFTIPDLPQFMCSPRGSIGWALKWALNSCGETVRPNWPCQQPVWTLCVCVFVFLYPIPFPRVLCTKQVFLTDMETFLSKWVDSSGGRKFQNLWIREREREVWNSYSVIRGGLPRGVIACLNLACFLVLEMFGFITSFAFLFIMN